MRNLKLFLASLFISTLIFAQDKECDKLFFKQKKNKSQTFQNDEIKSKMSGIYTSLKKNLGIYFISSNLENILKFQAINNDTKNPIILGNNIVISIVFENGNFHKIEFNSNEQVDKKIGDMVFTSNSIELSQELLSMFMNQKIKSIEILNPFGKNNNEILVKELSKSMKQRIIQISNCFNHKVNDVISKN